MGQANACVKEVGFLSAPTNFLAQWLRNYDSKILGLTILSMLCTAEPQTKIPQTKILWVRLQKTLHKKFRRCTKKVHPLHLRSSVTPTPIFLDLRLRFGRIPDRLYILVSVKKTLLQREGLEERFALKQKHRVRGWRAVSAAGLHWYYYHYTSIVIYVYIYIYIYVYIYIYIYTYIYIYISGQRLTAKECLLTDTGRNFNPGIEKVHQALNVG